jgi:hypothetical protein
MKQFSLLLALVCLVIVGGCSDRGIEPIQRYTLTIEDHETTPYEFPEGVYYSFVLPELQSFDFDVDAVFSQAEERGVRLRDAWYKSYNTGCKPTGSNIIMTVMVPGGFVVRVDERTPALKTIGFVETSNPDVEFCAYRVCHYDFED